VSVVVPVYDVTVVWNVEVEVKAELGIEVAGGIDIVIVVVPVNFVTVALNASELNVLNVAAIDPGNVGFEGGGDRLAGKLLEQPSGAFGAPFRHGRKPVRRDDWPLIASGTSRFRTCGYGYAVEQIFLSRALVLNV